MDLSHLGDVFALAVFIVGFRPLARRVGSHANLWFLGWGFLLLHELALMFQQTTGRMHLAAELVSIWTLALCALTFLMVSANVPRERIELPMMLAIASPVLLQSSISTVGMHPVWLGYAAVALFLAPLVCVLLDQRRSRPVTLVAACFALFAACMEPIALRNPMVAANGGISLVFLSAAYLYLIAAQRRTRGVIAAVAGLASWGIFCPVSLILRSRYPGLHISRALTSLPQFLVGAGILLTLLEEHVLRTERMAMHDPLTDLPNRRMFEERLIATMEEARNTRTTVACLVIDVDNFKTINDTLGHTAGDQLLRALAVRLSWHMSPRDILARTGGDEFTALLAGVSDEHHLRFIAGAMMAAGSVPIAIEGQSVDVRISIGIALSPDHADDIDGLRRAADAAMYSAKRRGGSLLAFAGEE